MSTTNLPSDTPSFDQSTSQVTQTTTGNRNTVFGIAENGSNITVNNYSQAPLHEQLNENTVSSPTGRAVNQWISTLLVPSFIFWIGGATAYVERFRYRGWQSLFASMSEPLQVVFLLAAFCIIIISAIVVQRFDQSALNFLEGNWPSWFLPLRVLSLVLIQKQKKRKETISAHWQKLMSAELSKRTSEHRHTIIKLDQMLRRIPIYNLRPTTLGNIIRAAEERPMEKYGLDADVCWPRLWLLLPSSTKQELRVARSDLYAASRVWLWSVLFVIWSLWSWWAIPVSLLSALLSYYHWAVAAAASYGDLVESAFDLYRLRLYENLQMNIPSNSKEEHQAGRQLTEFLWKGQ